jgi:hypothetical protein
MFEGRCTVKVFDAKGLGDEPFLQALRDKRVLQLLKSLDVIQRSKTCNLIMDMFVGSLYYRTWSGCGAPNHGGNYWVNGTLAGQATLATVILLNLSTEPTLTEPSNTTTYGTPHTWHGSNVSTSYAGKRFIEDDSEAHQIYVNPDGRESIVFLSRFLWLPSQGNLVNIRSVACGHAEDGDSTGSSQRGLTARVRLKDDGGNPITMGKTSDQALLVEYEHEFVSA